MLNAALKTNVLSQPPLVVGREGKWQFCAQFPHGSMHVIGLKVSEHGLRTQGPKILTNIHTPVLCPSKVLYKGVIMQLSYVAQFFNLELYKKKRE